MLWIEAVRQLSSDLTEPYELEFVWRNLHELDKLAWLNLMREKISASDLSALTEIAEQLKKHVPPQYIVGWAEFCGLKFKVDSRVLIPRPETEELVRLILQDFPDEKLRVLDIGTGSGAIAIALVQNRKNWRLTACDISPDALELAKENLSALTENQNGDKIKFIQSDVLDFWKNSSQKLSKFDIIVSNPPYIDRAEDDEVDLSVKTYEPDTALFASNHGLAIYQKIAQQAPSALTENGALYLEIGYQQGSAVRQLFEQAFPDKTVSVLQDFAGQDRIVRIR